MACFHRIWRNDLRFFLSRCHRFKLAAVRQRDKRLSCGTEPRLRSRRVMAISPARNVATPELIANSCGDFGVLLQTIRSTNCHWPSTCYQQHVERGFNIQNATACRNCWSQPIPHGVEVFRTVRARMQRNRAYRRSWRARVFGSCRRCCWERLRHPASQHMVGPKQRLESRASRLACFPAG